MLSDNILKLQEVDTKLERLKAMNKRDDVLDQFKIDNESIILGLEEERRALVNAIVILKMRELGYLN